MSRTCVAVVAAGLVLAACAGDDGDSLGSVLESVATTPEVVSTAPTTVPPTTPAPETSAATTAPPPPTTTEPAPPTTAFAPGPGDDRWTPACVDQPAPDTQPAADDSTLDVFGPLGTEPGMEFALPLHRSDASSEPEPSSVAIERVPGGLALLVRPSSYLVDAHGAIVTVVDHDGTVRWRRCIGGIDAAGLLAGGSTMLVGTYGPAASVRWLAFDPVSGADVEPPAEIAGFSAYPYGDRHVLLRRFDEQPVAADRENLTLFDRATGELEAIPYPPSADGKIPGEVEFVFSGDVLVHGDGYHPPVGVYDGERWLIDPESLAELVAAEAVYDFAGGGWSGRDGAGNVLWTKPDWLDVSGEGFRSIATEGVTLLVACRDSTFDPATGLCADTFFAGVETLTGEVLWERPGRQAAPVAANGLAIVTTGDDTYTMIDVRTGEPVDATQVWPGGSFQQGCCGEDEFLWSGRRGGVVVAVDYEHVAVYYPRDFTSDTVTVDLLA